MNTERLFSAITKEPPSVDNLRIPIIAFSNGLYLFDDADKTLERIDNPRFQIVARAYLGEAEVSCGLSTLCFDLAKDSALDLQDRRERDEALATIGQCEARSGLIADAHETVALLEDSTWRAVVLASIACAQAMRGEINAAFSTCDSAGHKEKAGLYEAIAEISIDSEIVSSGYRNLLLSLIEDQQYRQSVHDQVGTADCRGLSVTGKGSLPSLVRRIANRLETGVLQEPLQFVRKRLWGEAMEAAVKIQQPIERALAFSAIADYQARAGYDPTTAFTEAEAVATDSLHAGRIFCNLVAMRSKVGAELCINAKRDLKGLTFHELDEALKDATDDSHLLSSIRNCFLNTRGLRFSSPPEQDAILAWAKYSVDQSRSTLHGRLGKYCPLVADVPDTAMPEDADAPSQESEEEDSLLVYAVRELDLFILETREGRKWLRFPGAPEGEWQYAVEFLPYEYSRRLCTFCNLIDMREGRLMVSKSEKHWLEQIEVAAIKRYTALAKRRKKTIGLYVNLRERRWFLSPAEKAVPESIAPTDYGKELARNTPGIPGTAAASLKPRHIRWFTPKDKTGLPQTPAIARDPDVAQALTYCNGIKLLCDAKDTLQRVHAPRWRIDGHLHIARCESSLGWETKHIDLAYEGFQAAFGQATAEQGDLPPYSREHAAWQRQRAVRELECCLKDICLTQASLGDFSGANERCGELQYCRDEALSRIAVLEAKAGRLRAALSTCDLATDRKQLDKEVENLALECEDNAAFENVRLILALLSSQDHRNSLEDRVADLLMGRPDAKPEELPLDREVRAILAQAGIQSVGSTEGSFIEAVAYAFDGQFDIAAERALRLGLSPQACYAFALLAHLKVKAGLDGTVLFQWAQTLAGIDKHLLLTWARSAQGDCQRDFAAETNEWVSYYLKHNEQWHRDSLLSQLASLQAYSGSTACLQALDHIKQLTPEDYGKLVEKYQKNEAVLRALGCVLSNDEQTLALRSLQKEDREGARAGLLKGLYLIRDCKKGKPLATDFGFTPTATHNGVVRYSRVSRRKTGNTRNRARVVYQRKGPHGSTLTILGAEQQGSVLSRQTEIDTYNFPFTLNPTIGCLYGCSYCYLQKPFFSRHAKFGREMIVKEGLIPVLRKNLESYRRLPQHLRRVQIGPACEVYYPRVNKSYADDKKAGTMSNILHAFIEEQEAGYPWGIHVVTKSLEIEKDIPLLKELVCLQAEITITTLSEEEKRNCEGHAPSVARRFETIKRLSDAGLFVRVMVMPLFLKPGCLERIHKELAGASPEEIKKAEKQAEWEEANAIWLKAQECGALSVKTKGLNYFDRDDVGKNGSTPKSVNGRDENPEGELLIHGGEIVRNEDGTAQTRKVHTWWYEEGERKLRDGSAKKVKNQRKEGERERPVLDFGYQLMDTAKDLDWGDCRCTGKNLTWRELKAPVLASETGPKEEIIELFPHFFMIAWCPHCKQSLRVTTNYTARGADGRLYKNCKCTACTETFQYYFEGLDVRERFPSGRFPLSEGLFGFMEKHPEFTASLRLSDPRYYFIPQMVKASQPYAHTNSDDEVLGLFYIDQLNLQAKRKPLFTQDFVVNVDKRDAHFIVYAGTEAQGECVRPVREFLLKYGSFGEYHHRGNGKPWTPYYNGIEDLPDDVKYSARVALHAISETATTRGERVGGSNTSTDDQHRTLKGQLGEANETDKREAPSSKRASAFKVGQLFIERRMREVASKKTERDYFSLVVSIQGDPPRFTVFSFRVVARGEREAAGIFDLQANEYVEHELNAWRRDLTQTTGGGIELFTAQESIEHLLKEAFESYFENVKHGAGEDLQVARQKRFIPPLQAFRSQMGVMKLEVHWLKRQERVPPGSVVIF